MDKRQKEFSREHALFLAKIKKRERFIRFMRLFLFVLLFGLWELLADRGILDPFITSSPSRFLKSIANLYRDGVLFLHIGTTLLETAAGFLIGTLLGSFMAVGLWWSNTLCRILDPYLVILNALPKIALGPILIVWCGAGMKSIIVMAVLVSLVVTVMSVLSGFLEISAEKQLLMRTLGATKFQILRYVVIPSSVPNFMNALKISVGMSWVGVIVGEYLVSKAGLGYLIVYGGQVFKLDLVMGSIVILCVLAASMYFGVAWLEKRMGRGN